MKKQRKHYAPEEKVAILRRHLLEKEHGQCFLRRGTEGRSPLHLRDTGSLRFRIRPRRLRTGDAIPGRGNHTSGPG